MTRVGFKSLAHLMPTGERRTRQAVDRALLGQGATADGLVTAWTVRR